MHTDPHDAHISSLTMAKDAKTSTTARCATRRLATPMRVRKTCDDAFKDTGERFLASLRRRLAICSKRNQLIACKPLESFALFGRPVLGDFGRQSIRNLNEMRILVGVDETHLCLVSTEIDARAFQPRLKSVVGRGETVLRSVEIGVHARRGFDRPLVLAAFQSNAASISSRALRSGNATPPTAENTSS